MYKLNSLRFLKQTGLFCLCVLLACAFSNIVQAQSDQLASNGDLIKTLKEEGYTWVVYSSPDLEETIEWRSGFKHGDFKSSILKADVDGRAYFRVVIGRYASRKAAGRGRATLDSILPADAWLLKLNGRLSIIEMPVEAASSIAQPEDVNPQENQDNVPAHEMPEPAVEKIKNVTQIEEDQSPVEDTQEEMIETVQPPAPVSTANGSGDGFGVFLNRHFEAALQFSNVYEDNIDHDADFEAVQSYGMVPALQVRFRSSESDPLFAFEYLVARHAYSNTERWDRVSNAFRGVFEPGISEAFHMQTSVELSLKGSSEDRDISNQFQVMQELEYRFTRRHRLQLYGTYRIKRFPDQPGAQDFKPNAGINFERSNSDGERFETGARYEFNKEEEARGNYRRWTFTVEYRSPELKERNQFEIEVKHRRKFYTARFVEIEDEDFLRQDNRLSVGINWIYRFNRSVSTELGYEFETRSSNDPEKYYDANAFRLSMIYDL